MNEHSKLGTARPANPASTPSTSSAHSPQPRLLDECPLTREPRLALLPGHRRREMPHHLGVGVHLRETLEVGIAPLSEGDAFH
jgi:hypothetical protein